MKEISLFYLHFIILVLPLIISKINYFINNLLLIIFFTLNYFKISFVLNYYLNFFYIYFFFNFIFNDYFKNYIFVIDFKFFKN